VGRSSARPWRVVSKAWVWAVALTTAATSAGSTTNDTTAEPVVTSDAGTAQDSTGAVPTWREAKIVLTVDPSFAALPYASAAVEGAVLAWTRAASELPDVEIVQAESEGPAADSEAARVDHRLSFALDGDPRAGKALAITLVTADSDNRILDADIIFSGLHTFTDCSLDDAAQHDDTSRYDLQNVLTHELGHWFGLGENEHNANATMYAYVSPGETKKRDLDTEDIDQAQLAYFQADNAEGDQSCALRAPGTGHITSEIGYFAALGLLLFRANRRTRAHVAHRTRRHPQ
jgi:hypothetical protein